MNKDLKPNESSELPKQEASCCGSSCGCHAKGSTGKTRLIIGVVVLVAAGALVARAIAKNNTTASAPASASFAALPAAVLSPSNGAASVVDANAVMEISALSELNTVAKDMAGVFVFLPGNTNASVTEATAQIRSAAQTIERQMKGKIGVFTLKTDSRDYAQVATQMAVPGALAMVKGKGMAPVSGEMTEAKLVQAFVTASSAGGGCGPSAGGCGPSGCK